MGTFVPIPSSLRSSGGSFARAAIYHLTTSNYYSLMNSDPAIRVVMLPRDTNSQGTIFGGVILSYIDMAGPIEPHPTRRISRRTPNSPAVIGRMPGLDGHESPTTSGRDFVMSNQFAFYDRSIIG